MAFSLLPDSAPFNTEQRAWLNGFLAGWLGLNDADAPVAPLAALATALAVAEPEPTAPEPWHDPALALADRLRLAEAEPPAGRFMAAMAQLDCGACGYVCRTYAAAIARGDESRLNLCSPGGSDTSRALKKLVKESAPDASNGAPSTNGHAPTSAPLQERWSSENPYLGRVLSTTRLNGPDSEKSTHHIAIDLGSDGPSYSVGDSLGVLPENCGTLVADLMIMLGVSGEETVVSPRGRSVSLAEALAADCCLSELTDELSMLLTRVATDPADAERLRAWAEDDAPIAGWDVLDLLSAVPSARPEPAELMAALSALRPRLYSISSSPRKHAGEVHLTVRRVSYEHNSRERKGVASTMLADRVGPGAPIRLFVKKSHGFTLPADLDRPIIMIGPGTGIAPFRAFLHERDAQGATGPAWLFFGEQRSAHDFLYEAELRDLLARGVITHLDTAFSRDQDAKLYVQHRIVERGETLFRWLETGAYVYICGDAKRMAADVERALTEVIARHRNGDKDQAKAYLARMVSSGRYCKDVY